MLPGLLILRRRLYLCGVAHRRYSPPPRRPFVHQRGDCDVGCDPNCDLGCDGQPGSKCAKALNWADCCDCASCDWSRRERKHKKRAEADVHLPPRAAGKPRQG